MIPSRTVSLATACARVTREVPLQPWPGGHDGGYRLVGHGPRLLLVLPGLVGPADALAAIGDTLADEYRSVFVHYPTVPSLDPLLAGLDAVRRQQGAATVAICGGSFGALVAQAWLARDPAVIDRLVLSGAGPAEPGRAVSNARRLPWMARMPMAVWRTLLRLAVRLSTARSADRAYWRACYGEAIAALDWPHLESRYRIAIDVDRGGPPSPATLAGWAGEVLVIEGGRDAVASERARAALRAVFPRARFHRIADAGHGLALEQPDEWLRVTSAFLREP
ncbi:MAG: alpha/beta fold hydrolase [Vicinamibacterales bacterium]